jgi:hypothetical protein
MRLLRRGERLHRAIVGDVEGGMRVVERGQHADVGGKLGAHGALSIRAGAVAPACPRGRAAF